MPQMPLTERERVQSRRYTYHWTAWYVILAVVAMQVIWPDKPMDNVMVFLGGMAYFTLVEHAFAQIKRPTLL